MRYKVDESKLICNLCGNKFANQKKVKEHMAEMHKFKEEAVGGDTVEVDWSSFKNDVNVTV